MRSERRPRPRPRPLSLLLGSSTVRLDVYTAHSRSEESRTWKGAVEGTRSRWPRATRVRPHLPFGVWPKHRVGGALWEMPQDLWILDVRQQPVASLDWQESQPPMQTLKHDRLGQSDITPCSYLEPRGCDLSTATIQLVCRYPGVRCPDPALLDTVRSRFAGSR